MDFGLNTLSLTKLGITDEILNIIAELEDFKGNWRAISHLAPDRLKDLKRSATIESTGSSTRIEGSKLSDLEVEKVFTQLKRKSFKSRDEQEVAGYAYLAQEIFENFENMPFTENLIKQLHGILLKYSDKDDRHRGEYKKFPNHVEAYDHTGKSLGVVFETVIPFETPFKMQELVYWTRTNLDEKILHPLLVIAVFIVCFLAIHPFQDGNGRLSRLLTTLLLLKANFTYVQFASLENIIEASKDIYYLALRRTQGTFGSQNPDYQPWLLFFFRALKKQKQKLQSKVSKETILSLHLKTLEAQIINCLEQHGKLSISQMLQLIECNRNSLKKTLADMIKASQIHRHGKGKATWYTL
jgi:Fic family protein